MCSKPINAIVICSCFIRPLGGKAARFLCGHDEREWFVAAVPGGASSVVQAKEALKPRAIRARQDLLRVPSRLRNRRRNAVFRRQGEWFFVPASAWNRDPINEKFVLYNEPLRRGAGKAHIVEHLFRVAGELVYVCPKHPNCVTEMAYQRLLQTRPGAARMGLAGIATESARLRERPHPSSGSRDDHGCPDWYRVVLNTEMETESMRNVAFID